MFGVCFYYRLVIRCAHAAGSLVGSEPGPVWGENLHFCQLLQLSRLATLGLSGEVTEIREKGKDHGEEVEQSAQYVSLGSKYISILDLRASVF